MPYYYRPPESTLFSNKISGYLTNKLSSLYDELIKLEEELENEHKLKQEIDRRIRAVKKRLRKTKI
jgi:CII-binding regulator of phage lambda lysogenization HflD